MSQRLNRRVLLSIILGAFLGVEKFQSNFIQGGLYCLPISLQFNRRAGHFDRSTKLENKVFKMFQVSVFNDNVSDSQIVKTESVKTIGELKNFLYGVMETKGGIYASAVRLQDGATLVQTSGQPVRTCSANLTIDVELLNRYKKAAYA